jgi:hypothetical protein
VLGKLGQFLALSNADRRLFARAYVSLAEVHVALVRGGFQRVMEQAPVATRCGAEAWTRDDLKRARWYAGWLETASRYHVVRARCLHRSLALHRWLRQEGLPCELRIGVRKDGEELQAHAWIELGGHVVNDKPHQVATFAPLLAHDGKPATWEGESISKLARQVVVLGRNATWQ